MTSCSVSRVVVLHSSGVTLLSHLPRFPTSCEKKIVVLQVAVAISDKEMMRAAAISLSQGKLAANASALKQALQILVP